MPYVEELLCDTSVRVDVKHGDEHEVGRRSPTIPRALRRALAHRDRGGCRFPGCPNTRFLHVHHLVHRVREGDTNTTNCIQLCTFHHRLVHRAGWGVFGDGDAEIVFVSPSGKEFADGSPPTPPQMFRPVAGISERTIATALGERMDVRYAVEVFEHRWGFSRN